jgi:hypothetical protein
VVAEVRVEPGLELIEVLVAGVEQLAGRDEVVDEQRGDRDRRAEARREASPAPRPAAADEQEERRPEDDRQPARAGEAEQEPGQELARIDEGPRPGNGGDCRARAGAGRDDRRHVIGQVVLVERRVRVRPERDSDREEQQEHGQRMGLVPRRRELGGIPEHRPEREEQRDREAHAPTDRQPAEHPPRDDDVDRGERREDQLAVGRAAPRRDERQQHDRRQRRERDVAAWYAVGRLDRPDVVEAGVAAARVHGPDRVADRRLALEPRLRLPLEVVVDAVRPGGGVHEQGRQHEAQPDGDRGDGPEPAGTGCGDDRVAGGLWRIEWLRTTLCYPALHLSTLVQEAISP